MPCSQRKARILLKEGKAVINKYNPFTIQLTYATGETKQECHIGVDTGAKHIGIAVTSEDKVFYKAEVELRQDVSSNLGSRRIYRKKRNSKNMPYYKGFWLNDKVFVLGQVGYITGFTSGSAYIKNKNDEYITLPSKSYKQVGIASLRLLSHNNNWQYIRNAV